MLTLMLHTAETSSVKADALHEKNAVVPFIGVNTECRCIISIFGLENL